MPTVPVQAGKEATGPWASRPPSPHPSGQDARAPLVGPNGDAPDLQDLLFQANRCPQSSRIGQRAECPGFLRTLRGGFSIFWENRGFHHPAKIPQTSGLSQKGLSEEHYSTSVAIYLGFVRSAMDSTDLALRASPPSQPLWQARAAACRMREIAGFLSGSRPQRGECPPICFRCARHGSRSVARPCEGHPSRAYAGTQETTNPRRRQAGS